MKTFQDRFHRAVNSETLEQKRLVSEGENRKISSLRKNIVNNSI